MMITEAAREARAEVVMMLQMDLWVVLRIILSVDHGSWEARDKVLIMPFDDDDLVEVMRMNLLIVISINIKMVNMIKMIMMVTRMVITTYDHLWIVNGVKVII